MQSHTQTPDEQKLWYLRIAQTLQGPYTSAKVRHLLLNGEITLADEISTDRDSWHALREIAEVIPLKLRAELGDAAAQALLSTREHTQQRLGDAETARFPVAAFLNSLFITLGVVILAIWLGMPGLQDQPDCTADPQPGVNWRNCVLPGVDVGAASLAGANLNSAILRQARLMTTDLSRSDLRYADLRGADLSYAQLQQARLQGANLQAANLLHAELGGADLRAADLRGSRLNGANLQDVRLDGAIWVDGRICTAGSSGRCLP